jgi:RTX calcium-binding nonapeptide repeat (4 copies)
MKRLALAATAALLVLPVSGAFAKGVIQFKKQIDNTTCVLLTYGTDSDDVLDDSTTTCNADIYGFKGNDVLKGGAQNDILDGGKGSDVMTGNGGYDTYVFEKAADSKPAAPDEITDFDISLDTMDVSGVCANASVTCTFIGWNSFDGTPGEVAYSIAQAWFCDPVTHQCGDRYFTFVSIDLDGDELADFSVTLDGYNSLTSSNFTL